IEVVIQPDVELVPVVGVICFAGIDIQTGISPGKANSSRIQPVADSEVIRRRHSRQYHFLDVSAGIVALAIRVEGKQIDGRGCGGHSIQDWITAAIDGGVQLLCVARVNPRKVPECTLPRLIGKDGADEIFLVEEALFVNQEEKE